MPKTRTIDKQYLIENAEEILRRGPLQPDVIDSFLNGGNPGNDVVVQSSSGSTGKPLLIPRSPSDVADIAKRVIGPYLKEYGKPPERIAMFGGISHTQAALKMDMGGIAMRSYEMSEADELSAFTPDVISCYPSVIRELLYEHEEKLRGIKAIKLGGERIFEADTAKIFARLPNAIVIEQFGSTEVPAVALRVHRKGNSHPPYELQKQRFSFRIEPEDGWQPLIVRDDFEDLLFPVREFYNTGDEILVEDGEVMDVRRVGDPVYEFRELIQSLLEQGCVNLQIRREDSQILYYGDLKLPTTIDFQGKSFRTVNQKPERIATSNKLKLVC